MEKLTLMGEHYVCEVHLSSHTLDSSWECSSHGSGRVERVLSLGKLAWPRANPAPPPASSFRSFLSAIQHHVAVHHIPHVSPRGEKLHHLVTLSRQLRPPRFRIWILLQSSQYEFCIPDGFAGGLPQIRNSVRAAVSAASPALQISFRPAPPPQRPPPAPLAKPSPSPLPASSSPHLHRSRNSCPPGRGAGGQTLEPVAIFRVARK